MSIGSLLLGVTLLILVGLFLARPFLLANARYDRQKSQRQELLAQKEAVLARIRVLEFDYETGTILEADYQQQRQEMVAEAAGILKQLDELPSGAVETAPTNGVEREIETAVAQLRRRQLRPAAPAPVKASPKTSTPVRASDGKLKVANGRANFCSQCGQPVEQGDNFCAYCGHQISQPQTS